MKRLPIVAAALAALAGAGAVAAYAPSTTLPGGWRLSRPLQAPATTGTMPQGLALAPDGARLAVVEGGVNPPALRFVNPNDFNDMHVVPLEGAFGKPVWLADGTVDVPGANADAILNVNPDGYAVQTIALHKGAWPVALAFHAGETQMATANDGDGTVSLLDAPAFAESKHIDVGPHPADVVYAPDGNSLYVSLRGSSDVARVDLASEAVTRFHVGLHPSSLALSADGKTLYAALTDDDAIAEIDTQTNAVRGKIDVGMHEGRVRGAGASPNALLLHADTLYVTLGAQNAVAVIRNGRLVERVPAGWYPTGVALSPKALFVSDGKGESTRPNAEFDPEGKDDRANEYVAATLDGSVRAIPLTALSAGAALTNETVANIRPQWTAPAQTVLRPNGPIKHVIYIIRENRSYDQVLGDIAHANGDARLAMFGRQVTPNLHAIAERFAVLDNAYTNSQVSADGHNWTDSAFGNDYLERFWPANYGHRRKEYDFELREGPQSPHNGYLWDAAARAHVSLRDYGEQLTSGPAHFSVTGYPALQGHYDPHSIGWDLRTSDEVRVAEWRHEFDAYVREKNLPAFEIVYLPNDHTAGTRAGQPTPRAYVAINDHAVGELVDRVSHSPYWASTAIFSVEDDAQNGPDHVSNQRSTFYVASPYARGGVRHHHYSTASVVRTIELILGMQPLSIYDATAEPLYDVFGTVADARPYSVIAPRINTGEVNAKTAYGAQISAKLNFERPDAVDPRVLNDIIEHASR